MLFRSEQMGYGRINVYAALVAASRIVKRFHFEDDLMKHLRDDVFEKRFKEIREIDIYKRAGREIDHLDPGDLVIDPVIDEREGLEEVIQRLDRIERVVGSLGAPFVGAEDRPDVSGEVVEAALNGAHAEGAS